MGVADYDSDDDDKLATAISSAPAAPAVQSKPAVALPKPVKAQKPAAPAVAALALKDKKLQEIRKEIDAAKSATAVVKVVRSNMEKFWDFRWGAEALYQVAKRSTARTRKEWGDDASIKKLASKLIAAADDGALLAREGLDILLIALDGLRRMEAQDAEAQKAALERVVVCLVAEGWKRPVKLLVRLFWLGAPLKLEASKDLRDHLPVEIRGRSLDLDGADLALLVVALQNAGASKDDLLLEKVVIRMRSTEVAPEVLYKGLSATDLVEMGEGLKNFEVSEEAALRPLGLEVLRRRGELTPYESHRVHSAFETMKMPLPEVWMKPGSQHKRSGAEIVTTQAFAPAEGHEKKRRGQNNDVERTSPPRVVRDYKMMSY